jgi:dTDP-4-dehydrorhamnose 3,5-epimerase
MRVTDHKIPGVKIVQLDPKQDSRGNFIRVWDKKLLDLPWVQENEALSLKAHTLRGLHFQRPPHSENKLIRCVSGRMLDVFVDLRKDSSGFGKWGSVELSGEAHNMVLIPRGFAHGYMTLTDNCVVSYKVDAVYTQEAEGGLIWNDPTVGITWPSQQPILSEKDRALPQLAQIEPI